MLNILFNGHEIEYEKNINIINKLYHDPMSVECSLILTYFVRVGGHAFYHYRITLLN